MSNEVLTTALLQQLVRFNPPLSLPPSPPPQGFTMKKISKILAFIGGLGFMGLQYASYNGYIEVDYSGIEKDLARRLTNGKHKAMDEIAAKEQWDKVMDVIGYNMPAGGGFTAGVMMGLRY